MHTSHYPRLENRLYRLPPRKDYHVDYILHVVSITTHTHDRRKSIGKQETKKRREEKGKEVKEKERRRNRNWKENKRQEKQEKKRQEHEAKGKLKEKTKNVILL